jgi:glycerol-1-phosphate dehydrogenase [NAD(P)+]
MIYGSHRIAIPSILKVGKGNISHIGQIFKEYQVDNIAVFFGEGIYNIFGDTIINSLNSSSINILKTYEYDDTKIESIVDTAFTLPSKTEAIIGIGGGKVLDVAKYIGFLKHLPSICIPTSASNDGFASSTCSLIVNNRRSSLSAKMPYGVIVDLDVLKSAPEKFIYSGVGDLISKITALYDWQFEEAHKKSRVDDFAMLIAKKSVNSFVRTEFKSIKDDFFLKELVDSLIMNGVSTEIAQSSAPVSGSEHLISHALDKLLEKPELHGVQVGIASYIMSIVQNHRNERIKKVLQGTGFFTYAESLKMKRADFEVAIDMAPSIKPNRYTYIHVEEYRKRAKEILNSDEILLRILK